MSVTRNNIRENAIQFLVSITISLFSLAVLAFVFYSGTPEKNARFGDTVKYCFVMKIFLFIAFLPNLLK